MKAAIYQEQVITEYQGTPLIEALPTILSPREAMESLTIVPSYNEKERELDVHYRFHCIQRLFSYFQPLDTHLDIEQRISRAIRQGYIGKNPMKKVYAQRLAEGYDLVQKRSIDFENTFTQKATATGFTIIGMSGVGKTSAVEKILSLYPQCIAHTSYQGIPLLLTQLSWVKLDCPFDGSIKGLCISFFAEVDRILGTDYCKIYYGNRMTVDAMLPRMAQIASLYCVGVLVIDEIQHLSMAKSGGSDKMLNFFVTLVNTIGVPVILIGTTKALPILQGEFRQARRGSGQGDLLWDRMKNDVSWGIMVQAMWKNQWTLEQGLLTKEIKDTLYDQSQGIIDIAVKLYAMAQIKAIADGTEKVTVKEIVEVASDRLRLVKPMLDALRSGDIKRISRYEDIKPLNVEDYIAAQQSRVSFQEMKVQEIEPLEEQAILKLLEMDIPAKTARSAVKKVMKSSKANQSLAMVIQKAFKIALGIEENVNNETEKIFDENDIRGNNEDNYKELKDRGVIVGDEF